MALPSLVTLAQALGPVQQDYLLQARQMQALSFAVHIPLVCFGIAFPAMVLFMEWLGHRTGDPIYLTIARRWSRIMVALFAVGVITGTILSFEMGLLWPNFTATFGGVFGLGFAIEGFSFFLEAIFIGIYVYGWDRLSPRAHMLSALPIVITGFTGSLMVIAVNAWMNHPGGFRLVRGEAVDVHPFARAVRQLLPVARAGPHVPRRLHRHRLRRGRGLRDRAAARALGPLRAHGAGGPADDRGAGLAGAGAGRRLGGARRGQVAADEAGRARGPGPDRAAAPRSTCSAGTRTARSSSGSGSRSCSRCSPSTTPTRASRASTRSRPTQRPPVNVVRICFQTMVGIGTLLAALGAVVLYLRVRRRALPESALVLLGLALAGPLSVVALIAAGS